MLSDDLFEHLFPTSCDVDPVPCLPDPAFEQTSCTRLRQKPVPSGNFPSGIPDRPSRIFEILPEELRYLHHSHHPACLHSSFFTELDAYESGVIV